jgi:hypothetical protein
VRVVVTTSVILLLATTGAFAAVDRPPSPAAATRAFNGWLHDRYGNVQGYWTCPRGQTYGNEVACLSEARVGKTWHMTSANARLSGTRVVFSKPYDTTWVRHWSPYSDRYLKRGGGFTVPGRISVNGPAFDWAWIALGAHETWKRHRSFHLQGLDGPWTGLERFFDFTCSVRQNLVSCHNVFGDAMRYRPS